MIKAINELPYNQQQYGTFLTMVAILQLKASKHFVYFVSIAVVTFTLLGNFIVKNIIRSKRKLGLGNNFTMENLSQELSKPTIQKFERQKVIVNYINEIHSVDLVDMSQYSKINKGYKYIFTNIDIFSKIAYAFPLKSKKYKILNLVLKKYLKKNKSKFIWCDKEPAFLSKEMQLFFKNNNVKIYHTNSHLKAVVIE